MERGKLAAHASERTAGAHDGSKLAPSRRRCPGMGIHATPCPAPLACPQESIVLVEYPHRLRHLMPDRLASLVRLRDRRYGRTFLAIYGPERFAR